MEDGVGHDVAGQQDSDIRVDGNLPGAQGVADVAAGLARRDWLAVEPDAALVQFGRAGRGRYVHRFLS
jgi:hypothetical protein